MLTVSEQRKEGRQEMAGAILILIYVSINMMMVKDAWEYIKER